MEVNVTEEAAGRVGTRQVPPGWSGLIDFGIGHQEAPVTLESVLPDKQDNTHTHKQPTMLCILNNPHMYSYLKLSYADCR